MMPRKTAIASNFGLKSHFCLLFKDQFGLKSHSRGKHKRAQPTGQVMRGVEISNLWDLTIGKKTGPGSNCQDL
jgi:hypothetical protein